MVKKVAKATEQAQGSSKAKISKEEVKEEIHQEEQQSQQNDDIEDTMTVKEKKENAQKFAKAVKKMNAKIKSSIERKQLIKAVEALQAYQAKVKAEGAKGTKNLLESDDKFIQVSFTLTSVPERPTPRPLEIRSPHPF